MNNLFDLVFEITPSIEELAAKLYKGFKRYPFIFKKEPIEYKIVYDNYTGINDSKNLYNWGLVITREDLSKVFLYYRTDKHHLPNGICLNYFDI